MERNECDLSPRHVAAETSAASDRRSVKSSVSVRLQMTALSLTLSLQLTGVLLWISQSKWRQQSELVARDEEEEEGVEGFSGHLPPRILTLRFISYHIHIINIFFRHILRPNWR